MIGWYGVPRTAPSLLPSFKCTPPDLSFFCDERIEARITRALDLQAVDPDAAEPLWAGLERDIVDLAPWVPLFTPSHAHVFSERVGNYQFNPELKGSVRPTLGAIARFVETQATRSATTRAIEVTSHACWFEQRARSSTASSRRSTRDAVDTSLAAGTRRDSSRPHA